MRHLFASPDSVWHCYKPLQLTPDNKKAAVDLLQWYQPWYEATCLCCVPFSHFPNIIGTGAAEWWADWQSGSRDQALGINLEDYSVCQCTRPCTHARTHLNSMGCSRTNVFSIYLRYQNDNLQPVVVGEKVTRRIPKDPASEYIKALIELKKKIRSRLNAQKQWCSIGFQRDLMNILNSTMTRQLGSSSKCYN